MRNQKYYFNFYCLRLIKAIWRKLQITTNMRKIRISEKPLMMLLKRLLLQEQDIVGSLKEASLSSIHLMESQGLKWNIMNKQIIQHWSISIHMIVIQRHKPIYILVVTIWHVSRLKSIRLKVFKKVSDLITITHA